MSKASRSLKVTAIILSVASVVLWGVEGADVLGCVPARVGPADRSGAVTVTIVAALCWLARGLRRQGDEVYARVITEMAERQAQCERRHLRAEPGPLPPA
jgi:hypothetical protein